jgi:predicted amidohydrolase
MKGEREIMSEEIKEESYMVEKSKILEAAKKCATTKAALKILFPEAFKGNYFRSGDLFVVTNKQALNTRLTISKYFKDDGDSLVIVSHSSKSKVPLNQCVLLIHDGGQYQYRLIHLTTGYAYNEKSYKRTDDGSIEIPSEDLAGLTLYQEGISRPRSTPFY